VSLRDARESWFLDLISRIDTHFKPVKGRERSGTRCKAGRCVRVGLVGPLVIDSLGIRLSGERPSGINDFAGPNASLTHTRAATPWVGRCIQIVKEPLRYVQRSGGESLHSTT
jgi:hypothetical protein